MKTPLLSFPGGIHPAGKHKELSSSAKIQIAPLMEKYHVVLAQNVGKPPKMIVEPGSEVKKYQLIAEADGFVSANLHAPTSGKVTGIVQVPGAMGSLVPAIEIIADGKDEPCEAMPSIDWQNAGREELLQRIGDCGIVGMGGAAFPSRVKLSPPPEVTIDTVILNGAECEPYLSADHRLMLEQPEDVVLGAAILGKTMNVSKVVIGIEANKQDAYVKALVAQLLPSGICITSRGTLDGIPAKPNPSVALDLAAELGERPNECILIGDSEIDVLTAKNASFEILSVSWGYASRKTLYQHGAIDVIDAPIELLEYFNVAIMLAPGIINPISEYKDFYSDEMVDRIYDQKLPVQICDRKLFLTLVHSVLDGTYDESVIEKKLKTAYNKFVQEL